MPDKDELAAVDEQFAADPGGRANVTRALSEKENAEAYGNDTSSPDKVLAQYDWPPPKDEPEPEPEPVAKTKPAAAEARASAAEDKPEARTAPPRGRRAPSRATTKPGK